MTRRNVMFFVIISSRKRRKKKVLFVKWNLFGKHWHWKNMAEIVWGRPGTWKRKQGTTLPKYIRVEKKSAKIPHSIYTHVYSHAMFGSASPFSILFNETCSRNLKAFFILMESKDRHHVVSLQMGQESNNVQLKMRDIFFIYRSNNYSRLMVISLNYLL